MGLLSLPPAPPLPQVAIIAGNFELAEVIKTHKDSDVGEFCPPRSLLNVHLWGSSGPSSARVSGDVTRKPPYPEPFPSVLPVQLGVVH